VAMKTAPSGNPLLTLGARYEAVRRHTEPQGFLARSGYFANFSQAAAMLAVFTSPG
jgi:hypothetical protein